MMVALDDTLELDDTLRECTECGWRMKHDYYADGLEHVQERDESVVGDLVWAESMIGNEVVGNEAVDANGRT